MQLGHETLWLEVGMNFLADSERLLLHHGIDGYKFDGIYVVDI